MEEIRRILAAIRIADEKFDLLNVGDRLVIGVSGGKDSLVLVHALSLYQKFANKNITLLPVIIDLGFPNFDPQPLHDYIESLGLTLTVFPSTNVFPILQINQKENNLNHLPCSICSRMKKAAINKAAHQLEANKVAFAHHADDAIETLFMNEIHGGRIATFAPKMHLDRENITFVRPLILAYEKDIIRCAKQLQLPVIPSACPADKHTTREEIKHLLNQVYKAYPQAQTNFLSMLTNYQKADLWFDKIAYQTTIPGLIIRPVTTSDQRSVVMYINAKVFIEEQGFAVDEEFPQNDVKATYFLMELNDQPIATVRFYGEKNDFHIGRFAVLKQFRNRGYGTILFQFVENYLYQKIKPLTFHVGGQAHLLAYYQKLGYQIDGDLYYEGVVPHYQLIKSLP